MCKEMPVIPVSKVVDRKRIIGKNRGPRRRRGTGVADQKNGPPAIAIFRRFSLPRLPASQFPNHGAVDSEKISNNKKRRFSFKDDDSEKSPGQCGP
jgi:hypothetical protein